MRVRWGLLCVRVLMLATMACALLAAPVIAHGRQPADEGRARAALSSRFVWEVDLGLHGCTGVMCRDSRPLVAGRMAAMLGFHTNVAAGLHLAILSERVVIDGERAESTYSVLAGFELRFRVPVRRVLFWAGLAMGYFQRWQPVAQDGDSLYYAKLHGFGIGVGLGQGDRVLALGSLRSVSPDFLHE